MGRLLYISEFERDGEVYTERLVPKTCHWAESLKKKE